MGTTAADRFDLDAERSAQTTFTVTNPSGTADRVVFEPVAGPGAEPGWITVDASLLLVVAAGFVLLLVRTTEPEGTKPGSYEARGRAYSADSAPEETSVLSGRVVFDVAAPPAPRKRTIPWWEYAAAAVLLVVVSVTVTLVATLGRGAGQATAPQLAGLSRTDAVAALQKAGLTVGTVRHKFDQSNIEQVLDQSVRADSSVPDGTAVDLVVGATLSPPVPVTKEGARLAQGEPLRWRQPEAWVTRWQADASISLCVNGVCYAAPVLRATVDGPEYLVPVRVPYTVAELKVTVYTYGEWSVAAVDDFGTVGPAVPTMHLVFPDQPR